MSVVFMVAKTLFGCPLPYNLMAGMTASQPAFHSVLTAKNTQPFNYFQCLCWLRLRPFVLYRIISTFHLILMFYCIRFFSVCLRRMISLCSDWAANRRKYQKSFAVSRKRWIKCYSTESHSPLDAHRHIAWREIACCRTTKKNGT